MRVFSCTCGNRLFFDNERCMGCGRRAGFVPELAELVAIEGDDQHGWRALHPALQGRHFHRCRNYSQEEVCNWMVPVEDEHIFCQACRLNQVIPDLSKPAYRGYWAKIEAAKRRLIYGLNALQLPVFSRAEHPDRGLGFAFMADPSPGAEFSDDIGNDSRVQTGHNQGLITINISEADDVVREEMRRSMAERYRTLLGHFRHEIGHYYWLLLVQDSAHLHEFRNVFGDERRDYGQALSEYYERGPVADWSQRYISAYGSAHPWEDWAETFSHYLHMVDTLESAAQLKLAPIDPADRSEEGMQRWIAAWMELTVGLNELNRCMGHPDLYPFVLSHKAVEKLYFVHEVVAEAVGRPSQLLPVIGAGPDYRPAHGAR
jgi:hypothetical protein